MLTLSLYLHIVAAVLLVGGMLFLSTVLAPYLRTISDPAEKSKIFQAVGGRFRLWGWAALGVLLITGPLNLYLKGISPVAIFDPAFCSTAYGKILVTKLILVLIIITTSLTHDLWLGPAARKSKKYSKIALIMGRGNLLIALVIIALAVMLRTAL